MKGVILAGGKGTRLSPLTEITNKHLLPIGREPMIWHSVKQLVSAGIHNIMVITSNEHMGDVINSLGSGNRFNCELTYRVQESSIGIANALQLTEDFIAQNKVVVLLGDNIFEYSIKKYVIDYFLQAKGARVLLKKVDDPTRYGVAALDEQHIISIEEKPLIPKSPFAVVGCYMYDPRVFQYIREIGLSDRGEYEISHVNNLYIRDNALEFSFVEGRWTDAGTFESLLEANLMMYENNNRILTDG